MCVLCVCRDREREEMVYTDSVGMPTAAWPGVEKTGFVKADALTVHLARLTYYTLFSLSIAKRKRP